MGDMKEQAHELKAEVQAGAREKAEALKQRAEEEVEWRKRDTARRAHSLSAALETAGDTLEGRGERWLAERARDVADRVDRISDHVKDRDTRTLIHELEDTAREKPAMFLGGSFAAGLALGRFLHASGREAGTTRGAGRPRTTSGWAEEPTAGEVMERSDLDATGREARPQAGDRGGAGAPMDEPATGVRTGGAAMASRAAGSARTTASESAGQTGSGSSPGTVS